MHVLCVCTFTSSLAQYSPCDSIFEQRRRLVGMVDGSWKRDVDKESCPTQVPISCILHT